MKNLTIEKVIGREIIDSRGNPTVEAEVYLADGTIDAQFAGMITRLDYYVGEVLNKLKEKGLDENTIVLFTSDNGTQ